MSYKIHAENEVTGGKNKGIIRVVGDSGWYVKLSLEAESENASAAQRVMNTLLAQVEAIQEEEDGNGTP